MASSPSKAEWRALRRHARLGELDQARRILEELHTRYPGDAEVAAELARLRRGERLHAAEAPAQTRSRLIDEAAGTLKEDMRAHPLPGLASLPPAELRALHSRLRAALRTLKKAKLPAPSGTNAYSKALKAARSRHRQRLFKRIFVGCALLLAVATALAAAALQLHRHTESLKLKLNTAYAAADWQATEAHLRTADTALYRFINPSLTELIGRVQRWQAGIRQSAAELERHLTLYENLEAATTLSLQQRATILRRIQLLPAEHSRPLLTRWEELLRPLQEEFHAQRSAYLAELEAATAPHHFTADPRQDAALLRKNSRQLRSLLSTAGDAAVAYGLSPTLSHTLEARLKENETCLQDAKQCLLLDAKLTAARTWEQYTRALQDFHPQLYPPACRMAEQLRPLQNSSRIITDLLTYRYDLPAEIPPDLRNALLEKGPSFTQAFPASSEQVLLMQDAFTAQALHQQVYEVIHPDGYANYTDTPPRVTDTAVSFTLSALDPTFSLEAPRKQEWAHPQAVQIRLLNPTPLLRAAALSHDTFFLSANIPDLLGRIIGVQHKACPALAKAYLYHTLLKLIELHKRPEIIGLRYAPTLREDIASFKRLEQQCPIPLTMNCWLQHSGPALAAEKLCEQWFADHPKRDYAAEISRNFSRALQETPRYLGYVDPHGTPHYREQPPPHTKVLYYRSGKLSAAPAGAPLEGADAFSPLIAE